MLLLVLLGLSIGSVGAQGSPQGVAEDFLNAWHEQNYERMYDFVHPRAQDLYPQANFISRYQTAAQFTAFDGVEYTITDTKLQGQSALVTYDIIIQSNTFGTIEDTGRMMRLVTTGDGWRVAWSTMDIFDGLAGDATLTVQAQPQRRATIYDRNGEPLAQDGQTLTHIYSAKDQMTSERDCINLLWRVGRERISYLEQRFATQNSDTIFYLLSLTPAEYQQHAAGLQNTCGAVQDLNTLTSPPHRVYYGGNTTAHITGYVAQVTEEQLQQGFAQGELVGQTGVEAAYQRQLAGQPERVLRIVEAGGTIIREIASSSGEPPTPVQLTIDRDLQLVTAQAISDAFNYARIDWASVSSGGAAVVLDVETGGVLALASYPYFHPGIFNPASNMPDRGILVQQVLADPLEPLRNRAVSEQASPGSVFKIITAAAALDQGIVEPGEPFDCTLTWDGSAYGDAGGIREDWRVREDPENSPFTEAAGEVTPALALATSCNPFFWTQGAQLFNQTGASTLADYAERMGLTQPYSLDGAFNPATGVVPIPSNVTAAVNESIGQGDVTLPPIQMAVATASIANGGSVYEPYLLQQIGGFDGTAVNTQAEPNLLNELGFSEAVMAELREGMCAVTTNPEFGTAYGRFNDNFGWVDVTAPYSVCGKTGTAETGLYPNAWFVAYAPAENPEVAVVVMVEQSLEGSQVAAPIARRILDYYFQAPIAAYPAFWGDEFEYVPLAPVQGVG